MNMRHKLKISLPPRHVEKNKKQKTSHIDISLVVSKIMKSSGGTEIQILGGLSYSE